MPGGGGGRLIPPAGKRARARLLVYIICKIMILISRAPGQMGPSWAGNLRICAPRGSSAHISISRADEQASGRPAERAAGAICAGRAAREQSSARRRARPLCRPSRSPLLTLLACLLPSNCVRQQLCARQAKIEFLLPPPQPQLQPRPLPLPWPPPPSWLSSNNL